MLRRRPPRPPPVPGQGEGAPVAVMSPSEDHGKPVRLVGGTGSPDEPRLPPGYNLDLSDPDVLVLLCPDGEAIARFSARGATAAAIEREARAHHRERNQTA